MVFLRQFLNNACPNIVAPVAPPSGVTRGPANQASFQDCITQLSAQFHLAVTNQPADRYWAFQWYEMVIFLGSPSFWLDSASGRSGDNTKGVTVKLRFAAEQDANFRIDDECV